MLSDEGEIVFNFNYQTEHFDKNNKGSYESLRSSFQNLVPTNLDSSFPFMSEGFPSHLSRKKVPEMKDKMIFPNQVVESPDPENLCTTFENTVTKYGSTIALIHKKYTLTYSELNKKANQLAHHLRQSGVSSKTFVGVLTKDPVYAVIGLLGILKSGGIYVPLDPNHPIKRLMGLLADMKWPILLSDASLKNTFSQYRGDLFILDKEWSSFNQQGSTNPPSLSKKTHLAYLIFTSGSTGTPKGVLCEFGSLENLLASLNASISIEPGEYFLQNVSFSFDPSLWTTLWPLLQGATLILLNSREMADPKRISDIIQKYAIKTLHAGPSLTRSILAQKDILTKIRSLEHLIGGGEPWSVEDLKQLVGLLPRCTFTNVYGPTETTIHVTQWTYSSIHKRVSLKTIPIGKPIINVQAYILDDDLTLLPPFAPGELYIGGMALARGYLNDPSLTAKKFIPNPFCTPSLFNQKNSLRLYKTGDLARFLSDGTVEFLGRVDNQIKIRGFRIEPGEIVAQLNRGTHVSTSAVFLSCENNGDKALFAFIVPTPHRACSYDLGPTFYASSGEKISLFKGPSLMDDIETLKQMLSDELPDYFIPSTFIFLNKIPLHLKGKLDPLSFPKEFISEQKVKPLSPTQPIIFSILFWKIGRGSLDPEYFCR